MSLLWARSAGGETDEVHVLTPDNDDYVMVQEAGYDSTEPDGGVIRVRVRDAQGPYEDLPFTLLTFAYG